MTDDVAETVARQLRERAAQVRQTVASGREWLGNKHRPIPETDWSGVELDERAADLIERLTAERESETMEKIGKEKLPCDVHLPPNTYIRKGCPLSTLLVALAQRNGRDNSATIFALSSRPEENSRG